MRLLIFLILLYLGWRALKKRMAPHIEQGTKTFYEPERQIDDIMVKDPFCGVYFPKKSGVSLKVNGETLHFCSRECQEHYLSGKEPADK